MTKTESRNCRPFDQLFAKNVPHIMENIFLSLDFESFKKCLRVSSAWNELLTSESFLMRAKNVFQAEILECERDLWEDSKDGRVDEVRILLSSGLLNVNKMHAFRALHERPCFHRHILHASSDVCETPWNTATTALYEAANRGHKEVVQLLLQGGAEPDKGNNLGWTPLHIAVANNLRDVAQLLLENGADPHVADDYDGWTPLHAATNNGQKSMVKILIDGGADPNKASKAGMTPLTIAQEACRKSAFRMLATTMDVARGLSYKKRRFKPPRVWDVSNVFSEFGTFREL